MTYHYIKPDNIYKSMMDNTAMVRQFVEMYIAQSPVDFQQLTKSVQAGDYREIADAAHQIKPTMEYVGATALRLDFQELETAARQEEDLTAIREKLEAVHVKFDDFLHELTVFRDSL